jgi:hypothetical protein
METYWECRYCSTILYLGTSWRWVVNFIHRRLYLRGNSRSTIRIGASLGLRASLDSVE